MATKTFKVSLSLDNPRIIQSGINVHSFDKQSIKITIELTKNSQVYQIPTGAQIKISLLKLARQEQKIILDVPFTSADSIDWIVPDYLDGYQGEVRVGVYLIVGTENIDVGYFNITSSVSDIDSAAEEFTESVLQGWAIEDLTALLPKFQEVIDETTGKDVISAPEIILARNGEVDLKTRLDKDKQEVSAQLAQTIKQGEATVSDINKNKGLFDETYFTPEVKAQWSGTSPISTVVADESVTTPKIADKATTKEKLNTFVHDKIIDVEQKLNTQITDIGKRNFSLFRQTSGAVGTIDTLAINDTPAIRGGLVTVHLRLQAHDTITVGVFEKNGTIFKPINSETHELEQDMNKVQTNLIVEKGQYVGVHHAGTIAFNYLENFPYYYTASEFPTDVFEPERITNLGLAYYYSIGQISDLLTIKNQVDGILTSRIEHGNHLSELQSGKSVTNDSDGIVRVRDVYSQESGRLELVIDLANSNSFHIYVLDRDGEYFKIAEKELLHPKSDGLQRILTNLTINKGQYVGVEYVSNGFYTLNTAEIHYQYPSNTFFDDVLTEFDRFETFSLYHYFNVVEYGVFDELVEEVNRIGESNSQQGKFYGETVYMFGDSITYWDSPTINEEDKGRVYDVKGLGSYIRERLGATVYNHGIGGETAKQITDRLVTTDLSNAYSLIYSAGTNDVAKGVVLGTIDDPTTENTFYGNIKRAIEYAYSQNPYIRIYLFTPHKSDRITTSDGWVNAIVEIGKLYGIPVFNSFEEVQINSVNRDTYLSDGIHFYAEGYELFADGLIPFLVNH